MTAPGLFFYNLSVSCYDVLNNVSNNKLVHKNKWFLSFFLNTIRIHISHDNAVPWIYLDFSSISFDNHFIILLEIFKAFKKKYIFLIFWKESDINPFFSYWDSHVVTFEIILNKYSKVFGSVSAALCIFIS